jgi:hypothetical protein
MWLYGEHVLLVISGADIEERDHYCENRCYWYGTRGLGQASSGATSGGRELAGGALDTRFVWDIPQPSEIVTITSPS